MTSSAADVKASLKSTLEQNGVLPQLRAHLREEVSKALVSGGGESRSETAAAAKPVLSNENLLINELIR